MGNWHNEVFEELGWYNKEEDEEDTPKPEQYHQTGCRICGVITGLHKFSWEK